MSTGYRCVLTVLLLGGLGACTTSDPREGGFIGGVGGIASGQYRERVETRERELSEFETAGADLEARHAAVTAQRQALTIERQSLLEKLDRVERELTDTGKIIAHAERELIIDQEVLFDIKAQQLDLDQQLRRLQAAGAGATVESEQIEDLSVEAQRLREKLSQYVPNWREIVARD